MIVFFLPIIMISVLLDKILVMERQEVSSEEGLSSHFRTLRSL